MATVVWTGNSQNIAQVVTLQVTAVAVGGTLAATINGKNVTYTCITGDTVDTAAVGWQQLLSSSTAPAEFGEQDWTVDTDTVTATAAVPGQPFAGMTNGLTSAGGGGATVTQTTTQVSVSQSDPGLAANWNRAGTPAIPQNGDDVVVADSQVPILYNLAALVAVQFASYRRPQSYSGSIGLPAQNPAGYLEYRPTRFQFIGSGTLTMTLGEGPTGGGPSSERYDPGAQRFTLNALAGNAIDILGTNVNNVITAVASTVTVASAPGEVSTLASATLDGGAQLTLGPGVTFSGLLKNTGATANLACAPATLTLLNGATAVVTSIGLTYAAVSADSGSQLLWQSNATITALTLSRGSLLDKSQDVRAMTITNSTVDADCQLNDPNNAITYTNATAVNGQVTSGPFIYTGPKTVKVT